MTTAKHTWPGEWRSPHAPRLPVVMITARDETGIDYEVRITEDIIGVFYEEGEDQMCVWSTRRDFGQHDATLAGGAAFRYAASEQQRVADAWADAIVRAAGRLP